MPVELSRAGARIALPRRRLRPLLCLFSWVVCFGIGAALVLLMWPHGTATNGPRFWFWLIGVQNGVFFMALLFLRIIYEAEYLYALHRNRRRTQWLKNRIHAAQRPLQVLGSGYCLPLEGKLVGDVLATRTSLMKAHPQRGGSGRVVHTRFADDDALFAEYVSNEVLDHSELAGEFEGARTQGTPAADIAVPLIVHVVARALAPVVQSLQALCQYGPAYAPVVYVLTGSGQASLSVEEVGQALAKAGAPDLSRRAVPPEDGLMPVDAWLDAGEQRPLLIVAGEMRDKPSRGSTEGAVAVLLGSGAFELPDSVKVRALLHRSVADALDNLDTVITNAMLWGNADPDAVRAIWLSGLEGSMDTRLNAALRDAGMASLTQDDAQRRPDRFIGRAGAAGGWLAVAAALEAGAGTDLIVHAPQTASSVQAAVLHVNDQVNHAEAHDEYAQ